MSFSISATARELQAYLAGATAAPYQGAAVAGHQFQPDHADRRTGVPALRELSELADVAISRDGHGGISGRHLPEQLLCSSSSSRRAAAQHDIGLAVLLLHGQRAQRTAVAHRQAVQVAVSFRLVLWNLLYLAVLWSVFAVNSQSPILEDINIHFATAGPILTTSMPSLRSRASDRLPVLVRARPVRRPSWSALFCC